MARKDLKKKEQEPVKRKTDKKEADDYPDPDLEEQDQEMEDEGGKKSSRQEVTPFMCVQGKRVLTTIC